MKSIFKHNWIPLYLFPFLGGLLYASAFPIKGMPSFALGAIIGMGLLLSTLTFHSSEHDKRTLKGEILSVLAFSLGYNLLGYYWIPELLKVFGGLHAPFNYMVGWMFTLIITPHLIFFVLLKRLITKLSLKRATILANDEKRLLSFAILLTILEYIIPQQFPAHMAHPWLWLAPYLGPVKFFGAPLYSFVSFALALFIAFFMQTKRVTKLPLIVFSVTLVLGFFFPLSKTSSDSGESIKLRLVQGNIGNDLKIHSEQGLQLALSEVVQIYSGLSKKENGFEADLTIWPETSYPRLLRSKSLKEMPSSTPYEFKSIIHQTNSELYVGGYDLSDRRNDFYFETQYNAAFFFNSKMELADVYRKRILIPFGESLPFGPLNQTLAKMIQNISFFARGERFPLFSTKNGHNFNTAICYEILFSNFIRSYFNANEELPDFIINITNDSWYGNTSEPLQHLFLSHWRALEFDTPVVRVTNTGITSVLHEDGSESERLEYHTKGTLDITLPIRETKEKTFFQIVGFYGMFMIWIGLFAFLVLIRKRKTSS
ncbi:apolipoprotein N-acyltransferase [Halobacteriovorax sp. GB3]|uniref:apolipoprotein N-acyltransferase n=1 Tax=Halobacteriovorax sp. GB3 TaxID=2719615 RepID=UPI00236080DA|nr:apolipoprotein N-acyltransferase [Halobacteriovorax sp. GB3]MDD0854064.1 apolipoprotein N-acyltransferase [Halobacteriovorax sp. GB3]